MREIKKGDFVFFAGSFYEVAEVDLDFPFQDNIAIYDEPPSKHKDYLLKSSVRLALPCYNCQGQGCPTCSGFGKVIA